VLAGHIATAEAWGHFAKESAELLPLGTKAKNGNYHFKMSEMALRLYWIETTISVFPIFMHDKERTETAENTDEQALLALVATKQEQILGRRGALF